MRLFYTLIFYLIIPFVLLRLYWRGFKAPEYRHRWKERLAVYKKKYPSPVIWIHAVSVGEAEAVFPLVKQLQKKYPVDQFLVTTTTPTGAARVQDILADTVTHVYLPYDLPCVVHRFLSIFKPKIAIFMEKEIWPNLYASCAKNNIPIVIINARLSANSAKGYKKISWLVQPALQQVAWIASQTEEDKLQFLDIGATEGLVSVEGNLKFDLHIDEKIIQQAKNIKKELFSARFVWIIASTHDGEEEVFFDLYPELKKHIPNLLLMIVPRHPERFKSVQKLAEKMQLNTCMRSMRTSCTKKIDIYIADTMGELKLLYGTSDISFVGGSMVPVGGHNILEPALMNVPIIFGPHMVNFEKIKQQMLGLNAVIQCMNKAELIKTVIHLYKIPEDRQNMILKANEFVLKNQGVTEQVAHLVSRVLRQNDADI